MSLQTITFLCLLGRLKDYFINAYLVRQPMIVFAYPEIVGCLIA